MIVQFFNSGTSKASSAINYLLGAKDSEGKERNPPPNIFSGDKELTEFLIDSNQRKYKYSSGVISFKDNEKPTPKQLKEIVKSFRETFCPSLGPDKVNMLVVQHKEKSNVELHIVVPTQTLGMKSFNISPPGKHNQQLQKDFSAYWNHQLDYEQVVEDPLKASFSQFDMKVPTGEKNRERKRKLSYEISKRIQTGTIKDRSQLISFLETKGCQITRKGKDYLSIKLPNKDKAIRFKGGCFAEGADYKQLVQLSEATKGKSKLTYTEFKSIVKRMETTIQYRREFNEKRYAPKKRMPKAYTNLRSSKLQNKEVKPVHIHTGLSTPRYQENPKEQVTDKIQFIRAKGLSPKSKNKLKNTNGFKVLGSSAVSSAVASGGTIEAISLTIGMIEVQVVALGKQLTQVPIEHRTAIERQIAQLKIQLMRLAYQLEEARKAQLNSSNPTAKKNEVVTPSLIEFVDIKSHLKRWLCCL